MGLKWPLSKGSQFKFWVLKRYLKIHLSAIKKDSLGHAWNLAHKHTQNIISSLLAVNVIPVILLRGQVCNFKDYRNFDFNLRLYGYIYCVTK